MGDCCERLEVATGLECTLAWSVLRPVKGFSRLILTLIPLVYDKLTLVALNEVGDGYNRSVGRRQAECDPPNLCGPN